MKPRLVWIPTYNENGRGSLSTIEYGNESVLPFLPKRVFYIYNVPAKVCRGGHGHLLCQQFLVATSGMVFVKSEGEVHTLDRPDLGLYVPIGNVIEFEFSSPDAVLMVLASEPYNADDYIYESEKCCIDSECNCYACSRV